MWKTRRGEKPSAGDKKPSAGAGVQGAALPATKQLCEMNTSRKESLKAHQLHQQQHYDDQNVGLTYLASLEVGGEACDLVGGSHGSHLLWHVRA